jgi:superfamily I DNA/RNA helicase
VGKIHRAKGLEFKVVLVVGCDADAVPLSYQQKELVDEADREAFLEQERHLLYVACTRARERLVVTYSGTPSRWVGALVGQEGVVEFEPEVRV